MILMTLALFILLLEQKKIEQMKIKLSQEISDAKDVKQNLNTITKLDEKKEQKVIFKENL